MLFSPVESLPPPVQLHLSFLLCDSSFPLLVLQTAAIIYNGVVRLVCFSKKLLFVEAAVADLQPDTENKTSFFQMITPINQPFAADK